MWGQFVLDPEEFIASRFFITLYIYQERWHGSLTIGQYAYLRSSTEEGDSYLINTELRDSLETAIAVLKMEIVKLFTALSG